MAPRYVRRGVRPGREGPKARLEWFVRASDLILRVSIGVVVVSGAYMVYGIVSGHLAPEADAAGRAESIFQTCGITFTVAAILLSTCLFARHYDAPSIVYLGAVPGIVALFVVPFLVQTQGAQGTRIAEQLVQQMRLCGEMVLMIVALRAGIAVVDRVRRPPAPKGPAERPGKPEPAKKAGTRPPLWAKCWDLSYCHQILREVCPAYKQRKTCWKLKKGCNCDPDMIDRLVQARVTATTGSAQKQRTATEYMREELRDPSSTRSTRQLISCAKCPIYAEHQQQKFVIVNPVVIVAAFAAFYFAAAPLYTPAYKKALTALDTFSARFSFEPPGQPTAQESEDDEAERHGPDWKPIDTSPVVERSPVVLENEHRMATMLGRELNDYIVHWILYAVLCVFVLTQVLRFVEWAIFKQHW